MDPITIAAASGMQSRIDTLDLLANNLANTGTAGFKADREWYNRYLSPDTARDAEDRTTNLGTLPVVETHWTDFTQGTLTPTGSQLDFGLSGSGFFRVKGPNGVLLTRNGSFQLGRGGELQTKDGYTVLQPDGNTLKLDATRPFEVARDGSVYQDKQLVGRLGVVMPGKPEALRKEGQSAFRMSMDTPLQPANAVEVYQGQLESANSGPAEAAIKMVQVLRQFETLQRALTLGNEMNRKAVEEVARVTG